MPQGSILGPLLFNIFLNELLNEDINSKMYNYADDNTLSYTNQDINVIKSKLETDCTTAINWFHSNFISQT